MSFVDAQWECIPVLLQQMPRWVLWRFEEQDGRLTKVPLQADGVHLASTTSPATWCSWNDIHFSWGRRNGHVVNGIGFVIVEGDGIVGIDLDHCRDPQTGHIEPASLDIIERLNSYTEASPSGTGVHILARGVLPPGRRKKGGIELYNDKRFFTVTGEHIGGTPPEVEARQEALDRLYADLFSTQEETPPPKEEAHGGGYPGTDDELIAIALKSPGGHQFDLLWRGIWTGKYPSQSEADLALCSILAWWCGPNPERIDRLFRRSLLLRPKWDEHRGEHTYGQITIASALKDRREWYGNTNGTGPPEQESLRSFAFTDLGNGERFAAHCGASLRYCSPQKKWLAWQGTHWETDSHQRVEQLARTTLRAMYKEAGTLAKHAATIEDEGQRVKAAAIAQAMLGWARTSEAGTRVREMMKWAQMDCIISPDQLDVDPWVLNCPNGTLDLRSGVLRPHQQTDYLTKITRVPYDPDASCPLWEEFLSTIFANNNELIEYLQRALGYSLTGDTQEQCLFLGYGTGANGKSTFLETIRFMVGDYGKQAEFSSFLHKDKDTVRNDLADLRGARLVVASEIDEGRRLSEVVIKSITGGDTIKARFLFQEYFSFTPQLKLWLGVNHKPTIKGTDHGIWRRIHLIPFTVTIPKTEQNKNLKEALCVELPGILAWAVRGCLDWQQGGLLTPEIVASATAQYQKEQNLFLQFISDCCILKSGVQTKSSDLYSAYQEWTGDRATTQTAFGLKLSELGLSRGRFMGVVAWKGIGLVTTEENSK